MKIGSCGLAALAFLLTNAPASAAVIETVTVSNTYGFNLTIGGAADQKIGRSRETVFVGQRAPFVESDLGVDYVGEADKDSFFFLHNNYCVGACSTASSTVITFTVTNTGSAPVDLRFDSLITPGHLARVDGSAAARGGFDFSVVQRSEGVADRSLYTAFGTVSDDGLFVSNSLETPFDRQTLYEFTGGRVLDWSSTPLNLELGTLAAGASTQVSYSASYFVTAFEECQDIFACGGLQVVFGDPRNNGSVSTFARGIGAAAVGDPVTLINRAYDAFDVPYAFNLSGSPFPGLPLAQGPIIYDGTYDPLDLSAVPEPATWTSLLLGMALIGCALRRSRRRDASDAKDRWSWSG